MIPLIGWTLLATSSALAVESEQLSVDELSGLGLEDLLTVVVTASKHEQSLEEAPAIVEVISAEDIRRRGCRTVGEALRGVAGLALINDHVNWNVGVRGVYAEPGAASAVVKLMINGQPVSFRPTSANVFGHELIPIAAVKRIEVVRGPGSALYGANAFLGVINVITHDPSDLTEEQPFRQQLEAETYYLQNEHHSGMNGGASLLTAGSWWRVRYLLAATFNYADRSGLMLPGSEDIVLEDLHARFPDTFPSARGYPTPGYSSEIRRTYVRDPVSSNDLARTGSVYAAATLDGSELGELTLDLNYQYNDRFGEFQNFSILSHKNRLAYHNGFARLAYALTVGSQLSLKASVALAGGMPAAGDRLNDTYTPNLSYEREFGYWAVDAVLEGAYRFGQKGSLSFGFDYTHDREDLLTIRQFNSSTGDSILGNDPGSQTFANIGFYLNGSWKPIKGLGLTLGARGDYNNAIACAASEWSCFGSRADKQIDSATSGGPGSTITDRGLFQLSSRAALVYAFPFWGLYGKAIYGSSFKPPSPFQLYHEPVSVVGSSAGDPTLKPQTADTFEFMLGWNRSKELSLNLTSTLFFTSARDLVVLLKEKTTARTRNADVSTAGMELSARASWKSRLSGYINLSYLFHGETELKRRRGETEFEWQTSLFNADLPTALYPRLLANLGLNLHVPEWFLNTNVSFHFVGERQASITNNQLYDALDLNKSYSLDPYLIVNLTLSSSGIRLLGQQETIFALSVRGVPGSYVDPGFGGVDIPSLGPSVHLRVSQQF